MSKMRQPWACPSQRAPVTALAVELADGRRVPEHFHPEDQLVYACRGVMTVRTNEGTWVVPARRAVWIPASTPHSIVSFGTVSLRTLYLRRRLVRHLGHGCQVLNVSPLLRELILHACRFKTMSPRQKAHAHLIDLLIDQLEAVETVPLQLPTPSDPRAARVAKILVDDPSDQRSLDRICESAGASRRTIERLFQRETQLTLGRWRQQLRLQRSLQLMAAGEKVSHAAVEAGYSTASAFIGMFRKALGVTPRRYFDEATARLSGEQARS
jgi:AraC-like DNA-binding protein